MDGSGRLVVGEPQIAAMSVASVAVHSIAAPLRRMHPLLPANALPVGVVDVDVQQSRGSLGGGDVDSVEEVHGHGRVAAPDISRAAISPYADFVGRCAIR